ncbi:MAG: Na+/H+ antiporter NhaC family protein [Alphaproteobacteria bacterium]|nr:Na+/H+ antiporter NhaC family protein [Alphaproteobacteria bacterium]
METDFGALSLLPALLAIALALVSRNVYLSLFTATWLAGTMLQGWDPLGGLYQAVDPFLLDAIADRDHVKVTLFSLFVGAMVGVMSASGGTRALVELLIRLAQGRRSGMVAAWLGGLVVFFDDYANCLIVGSAMRPLGDRLRISREKLAYIVDSTAAPIASIALVSTWIGYEVGLMDQGLKDAGVDLDAYAFFVEGIGYRFYSIFTIFFVGAIALTGRDFGPMLEAERRVAKGGSWRDPEPGEAEADGDTPAPHPGYALIAALPVMALIGVTFVYLWIEGSKVAPEGARLFEVLGGADGYDAMLMASLVSMVLSGLLAAGSRALSPTETMDAGIEGMSQLFEALIVLMLAWSLGAAIGELDAAGYLVELLKSSLSPALLPTLVFVVSAATAFATGTSFGTMAIVMPVTLPLAFAMSTDPVIALAASGAVLSGACWGDHCSPISDTTVLSSVGAGCDLVAHVRTQLPYALACGAIAVLLGTLPAGYGVPLWVVLPAGIVACVAAVVVFGQRPEGA